MSQDGFLWPKPPTLMGAVSLCSTTSASLERLLKSMFPCGGEPVLVSSGRVGIVLALLTSEMRRESEIAVFPYASHCVIEAVGRVASPFIDLTSDRPSIVYHQWGIVQEKYSGNILIEDAVDTLCEKQTSLFPAGGRFEIWSLSKIIGSFGGAVVWCSSESDADRLRYLRDQRVSGSSFRWGLRLATAISKKFIPLWFGIESLGGPVPSWAINGLMSKILDWDITVEDRVKKLDIALPFTTNWFVLKKGRLPPVVPVKISDDVANELVSEGLTHGFRHFVIVDKNGASSFDRVFPIPIHQDISTARLEKFIAIIEKEKK